MAEMKQKKLMLLGGLRYLVPVIEAAHKAGYYVITCDYLPDNIAHKYSDEYHNVSIIDKDAVLELAARLQIDGIMSFAVDPGVVTAAYVQDRLGLPGNPYESVCVLQNKDRFRSFLAENGFNVPEASAYSSVAEAMADKDRFRFPVIVKPVDSAGSKGVTRVDSSDALENALICAFGCSFKGRIIIEEFIESSGCSSDSDCFSVDGKLKFISFSAQRFDPSASNPYTPSAYSWPSTMTRSQEAELSSELQRLLTLLGMRTSIYNVETRVGRDGRPYIMEVSPRGGGNRLSEMLRFSTGADLIMNAVKAAVGDSTEEMSSGHYDGHWAEVILHSDRSGVFRSVDISECMSGNVVEVDLWVDKGDRIESFKGANNAFGTIVLKFDSDEELNSRLSAVDEWLTINLD